MIRVTVDIVPYGYENQKRKLGEMEIINDGSGDKDVGNYIVRIEGVPQGMVEAHKRADGFWPLVRKALEDMT